MHKNLLASKHLTSNFFFLNEKLGNLHKMIVKTWLENSVMSNTTAFSSSSLIWFNG